MTLSFFDLDVRRRIERIEVNVQPPGIIFKPRYHRRQAGMSISGVNSGPSIPSQRSSHARCFVFDLLVGQEMQRTRAVVLLSGGPLGVPPTPSCAELSDFPTSRSTSAGGSLADSSNGRYKRRSVGLPATTRRHFRASSPLTTFFALVSQARSRLLELCGIGDPRRRGGPRLGSRSTGEKSSNVERSSLGPVFLAPGP